jgi:hypothetical protein
MLASPRPRPRHVVHRRPRPSTRERPASYGGDDAGHRLDNMSNDPILELLSLVSDGRTLAKVRPLTRSEMKQRFVLNPVGVAEYRDGAGRVRVTISIHPGTGDRRVRVDDKGYSAERDGRRQEAVEAIAASAYTRQPEMPWKAPRHRSDRASTTFRCRASSPSDDGMLPGVGGGRFYFLGSGSPRRPRARLQRARPGRRRGWRARGGRRRVRRGPPRRRRGWPPRRRSPRRPRAGWPSTSAPWPASAAAEQGAGGLREVVSLRRGPA